MGETYLGETTFGGLTEELSNTITAVPASATASFPTPFPSVPAPVAPPTFGGMTFGGLLGMALGNVITTVVPASATASAATPALHAGDRFILLAGSAAASAPPPAVKITVTSPVAAATASGPVPHIPHGTPRADLPTSLTLDRELFLGLAERTTTLAIGRDTTLRLDGRATQQRLYVLASEIAFPGNTELALASLATSLELDQETTLVLHDLGLELALDG